MRSSDEMDEVLQALFCLGEEHKVPASEDEVLQRSGVSAEALRQAVEGGLVAEGAGGLALSERGVAEAEGVVRRHRLAERLLHDVLRVADEATESAACRFEHVLQGEVTESICTLLGHPRACPHGKPIPRGPCCSNGDESVSAVIRKLSVLRAGECGRVAYIHTASAERLNRLSSFGLVPGSLVRVHQRWPSIVIELGESQLALDRETAADVFVRKGTAGEDTPKRTRARVSGLWKKG